MPITDLTLSDTLRHHERQASYCYERARHPLAKYETRMAWEREAEFHLTLSDVLRATIGRPVPLVGQRSTGNRRSIRNAQFRAWMTRPRFSPLKRDADGSYRYSHDGVTYRVRDEPLRVYPLEMYGTCSVAPEPLPHPWVRLWRRVMWGG